jgi:hypothetical protein
MPNKYLNRSFPCLSLETICVNNQPKKIWETTMKKIINVAVFTAILAGAAVSAQATDIRVNMYGASAQRDYWKYLGQTFMTGELVDNGMNCESAHYAKASGDSNYYVIKGENCEFAGKADPLQVEFDDIYITYASTASNEGIRAVKEVEALDPAKYGCGTAYDQRKIVDVSSCGLDAVWPADGGCSATLVCGDIDLGTSDVEGASFTQSTTGAPYGHMGGTSKTYTVTPEDTAGLKTYYPTVVPFAFYANDVYETVADAGVDNLTRTQALNLFGAHVNNWNQFVGYDDRKVVLCFRHAGSGTHATLDKAVFRGDDTIKSSQVTFGTGYRAYFYKSSSSTRTGEAGMLECVANNANLSDATYMAVGYMDADTVDDRVVKLKYQGALPTADEIIKGSYDFWAKQNVLVDEAEDTAFVQEMMEFAAENVPTEKEEYWVPAGSLDVKKAHDTSIPLF